MNAVEARRVQRLPNMWEVPQDLRDRFGSKAGRQRAHEFNGHLVILLHHVPLVRNVRRNAVYFWRHNLGEWSCSEGRHGVETVLEHVVKFEDAIESLENRVASASTTEEWFDILAAAAPLRRAARNMADALHHAQELLPEGARIELQEAAESATEVARDVELLQEQSQHSIDFLLARQNELQTLASQTHADAVRRLNVIAALFLPTATLASVFGMNLPNGLERSSVFFFWLVVVTGLALGAGVGAQVIQLKSWKPQDW